MIRGLEFVADLKNRRLKKDHPLHLTKDN